ncbi:MAG: hypothetical protein B6D61_12025 [Bacteroidetes bacterium 4484_249]|nr:MAG: hypothetical protein B6D61_12025 [Bacteroidetes bacterium 4484_249]
MDKIIIINDSGIQSELEEFLITNKKHIRFSSDMDEISLSKNSLLQGIIKRYEEKHKVKIQSKDYIRFFQANDIIRFKANKGKTIIFLTNNNIVEINETIDNIEQQLEYQPFLRIHEDHIVNLHYVSRIINDNKDFLELTNKEELPLSSKNKEILLEQLYKYIK